MSEAIPLPSFDFRIPEERIIKVYGAPGTGKTSTLIRMIEHLIGFEDHSEFLNQYGVKLPYAQYNASDIIFMTFQTSALKEFEERTGITVKAKQNKEGRYYSTVHGVAFRLLLDSELLDGRITQKFGSLSPEDWFALFCRREGLRFDSSEMGFSNIFNDGNRLWNAMTWAINVYYPTKPDWVLTKIATKLPPKLWKYIGLWEAYKQEKGILDYNDMLIKAYEGLKSGEIDPRNLPRHKYSPKVLIVDEFQDLSPLQFEIFRFLANYMDLVIIAGDDDQTIFSYQGADPRLMNYVPGMEIILGKSHRLPIVVYAKALKVIRRARNRREKRVAPKDPREEVGEFRHRLFYYPDFLRCLVEEANKGHSIFILVRTNKQVLKLGKELILSGVHFYDLVTLLYYSKFVDWHLREGLTEKERNKLIARQMEKIIEGLSRGQLSLDLLEVKKNPFDVLDLEKVKSLNPKFGETAVDLIKELINEKANVVSIPKDAKIYLDTIHASKGREADVVFLINDLPRKWSSILRTPEELDAERRVWYVGLTRAREKVYVLNGKHPFPIY